MAENEAQVGKSSSLSDLRQFRVQKIPVDKPQQKELLPGKKRIIMLQDSDSDDPNSPKKVKVELKLPAVEKKKIEGSGETHSPKTAKAELTVKEKEERFKTVDRLAPEYDTMDIQDSLVRSNWDMDQALIYLKEKCFPKRRGNSFIKQPKVTMDNNSSVKRAAMPAQPNNGSSKPPKNRVNKPNNYSDCEDSDDDEVHESADMVYDSEDSDTEMSNHMTGQRKKVFDFMNTAGLLELQTIKTLSEKKANLVVEQRPFVSWKDLRDKLESNKSLSADILNYAQDLINKQNNVANILQKCNKMVKRLEAAIATGAGIVDQPKTLNKNYKLADYQMIGLNWLTVMHNQKMNGILADEMGLGKTIQVIAFLAYLKENNMSKGAHLIVVPSSTLDNWEAEITRWCPSFVIEKYHGSQDERRRMRAHYAKNGFHGFDVILTTYHIVGATPEERKMFRVCKLHYVIFDEAHMLKNMTTQRYTNLITINAEMRILLTGTPLQNNLLELMSLLCFVMPKFFGRSMDDIKSLFAKKNKSDNGNEEVSQFQETQVERAKRIMKPFVLRRLKKDVLNNLPKKSTHLQKVPMSEQQRIYYHELVDYYSTNKGLICTGERTGLSIMTEMRKIANHPLLMRHYFSDETLRSLAERLASVSTYKKTNTQYIFEELAVMSDFKIWQLCNKHELYDVTIPNSLICDSGKFQHLDKLLPKLKAEGHRALIFSQFTMMLDIVERYLEIRHHGYCRLDGSTAVNERHDMINDFNGDSDIFIFLLSTRAGGVGINLTAADTCIIHDIDFNPYNDKQAEDRCHRMGQTRPVTIYRLVSESSIEEGILLAAEEKLKLEQDITSTEKGGEVQEQKCVVRLLTMALGLDKDEEEQLNKSINDSFISDESPEK